MRVAISAEDNQGLDGLVGQHFGRCPYFVIVDVEEGEFTNTKVVENPFFAAHQPGMVPEFIHSQGAEVMISGGMGRRAIAFFEGYGITPATGAMGTVRQSLERYLEGKLTGAAPCRDGDHHGQGPRSQAGCDGPHGDHHH
ncbi:MAG: NifB/NifX family molybdenum-iron cluster-binding protein [Anaerolineales bacterium]|jgi:predicted Fe-Mo cluster-binding NifX family protein